MNRHSSIAKPARLRDRLRETTCQAILAAAEAAFAEQGARAPMESIAGRAGIAVGTLYNHFADREALWEAVCGARRRELLAQLDRALEDGKELPLEGALRLFTGALIACWVEHRGFLSVLAQTEPCMAHPGKEGSTPHHIAARAMRLVRRGIAEGLLEPEGAKLHALFFVGMLRSALLFGEALVAEELCDGAVSFFLHGAGKRR